MIVLQPSEEQEVWLCCDRCGEWLLNLGYSPMPLDTVIGKSAISHRCPEELG